MLLPSSRALALAIGGLLLFPHQPALGQSPSPESAEARAALRPDAGLRAPAISALRGPVDEAQYVVGPGDALSVTVSGASIDSYRLVITPEGDAVLPGVTVARVAGLRLAEAKQRLQQALAKHFRNVDITISLIELRRIEVNVLGNVTRPGTYVGTALDPCSALLDAAGGLGEGASRRNITVTRRNGDRERVDLVRYQQLADLASNPRILDGDVIFVPFEKERIGLWGAVERPGVYEFVDGDSLGALVDIAGGLARSARMDSIEVRRFVDDERTEALAFPVAEAGGQLLQDGDQVYAGFLTQYRTMTFVTLEGEFLHPGPYGISEGVDSLASVIERAGGFTEAASLEEGTLIRTTGVDPTDLEYERLKNVPIEDMTETEYAYFKSKARERKGLVVVNLAKLAAGDPAEDRALQNGDRVYAPKRRATVTVSGNVKLPGLITYLPGKKPGHYISEAGGYAERADKGGSRVIRSVTGEWEPLRRVAVIVPGDEIWVPEKPERNWWAFAQDAVRFAASIATVYLVIDQATD